MKKDITVKIEGDLSCNALENYYKQLWRALKLQYGNDIILKILENINIK